MPSSIVTVPFVSSTGVLAAAITIPLVGIVVVSLRFWQRSFQKVKVAADDYLILLALVFVVGMGICLVYGTAKKALAYPTPQLPNANMETQLTHIVSKQRLVQLLDTIIWCLMVPANGCIKLSAILLYRRIFVIDKNSVFEIVTRLSLVFMAAWTVAFFFASLLGCGKHFDYPWAPLAYVSKCNINTRVDVLMISDLITDVFVWLLPIPVIWNLHMRILRKLMVTGTMMLAAMSLVAAVVRLTVQSEISNSGYAAHADTDLTLTILLYWSMIESGLGVIAACLPTLHKFITPTSTRFMLERVRRTWKRDSLRSYSSASSRPFKEAPSSNTQGEFRGSKPTYREVIELSENTTRAYGAPYLERDSSTSSRTNMPAQAYLKDFSTRL